MAKGDMKITFKGIAAMTKEFDKQIQELGAALGIVGGSTDEVIAALKRTIDIVPEESTREELIRKWLVDDGSWAAREESKINVGDFLTINEKAGAFRKWKSGDRVVGTYIGDDKISIGETHIMAKRKVKAKKADSPFRKGRAVRRAGGGQFVGVKEGEPLSFAPLVGLEDMISADMHEYWDLRPAIYHPCIGRGCPGCEVGNEPRFKGYLPILLQSGETAVYPFTISVYNQLEALEDALDDGEDLKGFAIKVSRKGAGMATRYTVLGTGKRLDVEETEVPDFISHLGPQTEDTIWELLENNGFSRSDGTDAPDSDADEADEDEDGWGDV